MRILKRLGCLSLLLLVALFVAAIMWPPSGRALTGWARGESFYRGQPSSYWSEEARSLDRQRSKAARDSLKEGGVEAVPVLLEMMKPGDATARDCKFMIVRLGRQTVPILSEAVLQKRTRWDAVQVLETLGPDAKEAVPALLEALEQEPNLRSNEYFLMALAIWRIDRRAAIEAGIAGPGPTFEPIIPPWRRNDDAQYP